MSDPNKIDVDAVVQNAIGDKPWSVQKAFNDVMLQRVSDVIAGKRDEVARSYGIDDDADLDAEPTEQELEDILADLEDEEDVEDVEQDDEEQEELEEPDEDLGSEEEVEEVIDDEEEETDGEKS